MSFAVTSSTGLSLLALSLSSLDRPDFSIAEICQQIFSCTYLKPFDRDPNLTLGSNEFEVIDPSICRVTHGAMHAARVAAYIKILHVFQSNVFQNTQKGLFSQANVAGLSQPQMIHLTQIVGCLHDAARRGEAMDRWDKESGELCYNTLHQLFTDITPSTSSAFSSMITYKDEPQGYVDHLTSIGIPKEQVPLWNYLRELVHDADCLDVMRVRKTFKVEFLSLAGRAANPYGATALLSLVCQIRDLIHEQADMYKDLSIQHPFKDLSPITSLEKKFSIDIKKGYEHAFNVYEKVIHDMQGFSWLKAITQPLGISAVDLSAIEKIPLPDNAEHLAKHLTIFSQDDCKVFYGGPVDHGHGVKWVMPAAFYSSCGKIRSAYEICFINCCPTKQGLQGVPVYFVKVSDLDLKIRSTALETSAFFQLINNEDPARQAILIRETDILHVAFQHIYNGYLFSEVRPEDASVVCQFLSQEYSANTEIIELPSQNERRFEKVLSEFHGVIDARKVAIPIAKKVHTFFIEHYVFHEDPWASYYIFRSDTSESSLCGKDVFLRIDSGCNTGMIYQDERCSCQRELEEGLEGLMDSKNKESLLIHIPAHDGRGMGMAPKGETEIYKRGGQGRLHHTHPLGDVEAARLLYGTDQIDVRTYDGCVAILKHLGISRVKLISRSANKKQALEKGGIAVTNF